MSFSRTISDTACPTDLGAEARLAQALASRICHDLVNPVGAVVNGMDLLGEMAGMRADDEVALIAQSARRAADVLAFHRLAFGAAGPDSAELARAAVMQTVRAMLEGPRVPVTATGENGPALGRTVARAVALAALCGRGLMGMGGRMALDFDPQRALPVRIGIEAIDTERKGALLERLGHAGAGGAGLDPRTLEYALIHSAVAAAGARLDVTVEGGAATLSLLPL